MRLKTVNIELGKTDMTKKPTNISNIRIGRKVRFELPKSSTIDHNNDDELSYISTAVMRDQFSQVDPFDIQMKKDMRKVHGTANYVNGTLNFSTNDFTMRSTKTIQSVAAKNPPKLPPILFRNQLTNDASAKNARKNCSIDQQYWDNAVRKRGILLHVSVDNQQSEHIKFRKNKIQRYTSIFMKPSNYLKRSQNRVYDRTKTQLTSSSNTLELPTYKQVNKTTKTKLKNPFDKFSYKLISIKKPTRKHAQVNGANKLQTVDNFDARATTIVQNAFNQPTELEHQCTSENLSEILQMAHRWQSTTHNLPNSDNESASKSSTSVEFRTLKKLGAKQ